MQKSELNMYDEPNGKERSRAGARAVGCDQVVTAGACSAHRRGDGASVSRRRFIGASVITLGAFVLSGCSQGSASSPAAGVSGSSDASSGSASASSTSSAASDASASSQASSTALHGLKEDMTFVQGTLRDRGFVVDDVLRSPSLGDIHFSMSVPSSYDGTKPIPLYIHVAGYESWYANGVGNNLWSDFLFEAANYIGDAILVSPQMSDWHDTSANVLVALTEWLLDTYNINRSRVYLSGYSFGGDTISLAMGKRPELYSRVLHMASRWDGDVSALTKAKVPVRMVIGDGDEYYRVSDAERTYAAIRDSYAAAGVPEAEINELVVLDVKDAEYFKDLDSQHSDGAGLYAHDPEIMGWLFWNG